MKTLKIILSWLAMVIVYQASFSQVPQGFKYQAICRDNTGALIQNQPVNIRLSVHDVDPLGTILYQETFTLVTNQFGLIMADVGKGNVQSGNFATIPWETWDKFLEIELDMGSGFSSMGTTQLLSVPYALHAGTAESLVGGIIETDPEVGTNSLNYLSKWDGTSLVSSSVFDNGRIGIGTTTPFRKLHIVGTDGGLNSGLMLQDPYDIYLDFSVTNAPMGMQIHADQTSQLDFLIGGQAKMSIHPSGNIGIGTWEPSKKLTVAGNAQVQSNGEWIPGASARLYLGPDDNMWIEHIHSGGLNLEVCNGWPFYIRNGGNVTMAIDGSGNVGIGTMYPSAKLDVWNGNITVSNGGVISNYGFWGDELRSNWGNDLTLQSSYEDKAILFKTYTGEKVRIDPAGKVGIGTDAPVTLLDVNGVINAVGGNSDNWNLAYSWGNHANAGYLTSVDDMILGNEVTNATNTTLMRSGEGTNVSPFTLSLNTGNANVWTASQTFSMNTYFPGTSVWTSTGKLGIGTTNPGADSKLEVWDGNITVLNGGVLANTGFWGDILRTNWGNDLTLQSSYANKGIIFRTQSGEKVKIDAAGNVGIGTGSPSSLLHLIGDSPRLKLQTQTNLTDPSLEFVKYGVRTMEIKLTENGGATGLQFIDENSGQVRFFIEASTTNVGIGTTSPAATLDVNGQVKIAGGSPGAGKVLTSDATGLATWESPASSDAHYIGEVYGGGIVFYVYDNGQHGLIAATSDQSTGIQWSNGLYKYTGTTGDGLGAGAMNTAMIVAMQMGDNETGNFAAKVCTDYSVTANGIVYGDWYLPSKYESDLLYLQKDIVGGFAEADYWTSTEEPWANSFAKHRYFGNGAQTFPSDVKYHTFRVRAIRAF